jgi:hypothetical protein
LDGSQGELNRFRSSAAWVGAVRLEDGRYLLTIKGSDSEGNGWFFISDRPELNQSTKWVFLNDWKETDFSKDLYWEHWDNFNLVTECTTGEVYGIGLGTKNNLLRLYRLNNREKKFGFEWIASAQLKTGGPMISLRYGGGVHVTPEGELTIYVVNRQPPMKIREFRSRY